MTWFLRTSEEVNKGECHGVGSKTRRRAVTDRVMTHPVTPVNRLPAQRVASSTAGTGLSRVQIEHQFMALQKTAE